ncbi:MAG: 2-oxo acid dehydrogenase subunit E2 [Propionibacteriaceae bacterium]|jgi:2-oxoglutarate dehydrogenase E2 component (dihydrolipoamide succinyltransferase)|nr:2-oxo acid dehydrogenase subunit E2 [Propionibacteriaceae bacterium]
MTTQVTLPALGESVFEGTVSRWLKQVGDRVEADEPLLEVSTDKVDTEIPAPAAGLLLEIRVREDETAPVGAVLALIGQPDEATVPPADSTPSEPAQPEAAQPEPTRYEPFPGSNQATTPPAPALPSPATAWSGPIEPTAESAATEPPSPPPLPAWAQPSQGPLFGPLPGPPVRSEAPAPAAVSPDPVRPSPDQIVEQPSPATLATAAAATASTTGLEPTEPTEPPATEPTTTEPTEPTGESPVIPSPPVDPIAPRPVAGNSEVTGPYVTPLVRRLAAEHGIDLSQVAGSGVGGRIRKEDILTAAGGAKPVATPAPTLDPAAPLRPSPVAEPDQPAQPISAPELAPPTAPTPTTAEPVPTTVLAPPPQLPQPPRPSQPASRPPEAPAPSPGQPSLGLARPAAIAPPAAVAGTTEKISRLRASVAQRMVESLRVAAQLTATVEVDLTAISKLRGTVKDSFRTREGVGLTYLPFITKAAVEALKQFPKVNATIDLEAGLISYADGVHVGVAVDTPRGLLVPVVRDAGDLTVGGLAKKIADLASRTRSSQVTPDELAGGTFTITNYGAAGTLFDTPIINQPQVAILGTGALVKRPVVVADDRMGDIIAVRDMMYMSLTYDHRLVDGADAARFLAAIKARLEQGEFAAELGALA